LGLPIHFIDLKARKILYGVSGSIPLEKRGGIGSNPIRESNKSRDGGSTTTRQ